jgi:hypothetical protein
MVSYLSSRLAQPSEARSDPSHPAAEKSCERSGGAAREPGGRRRQPDRRPQRVPREVTGPDAGGCALQLEHGDLLQQLLVQRGGGRSRPESVCLPRLGPDGPSARCRRSGGLPGVAPASVAGCRLVALTVRARGGVAVMGAARRARGCARGYRLDGECRENRPDDRESRDPSHECS